MPQDMTYYEAHPDAYLELSQDDQAKVFEGGSIEGETTSESPDAETTDETPEQEAVAEPEQEAPAPVLLAKDGQHTIPYEELLSARDLAKHYEQIAREQSALIESLKQAATAPAPEQSTLADRLAELQQEYTEAKILEETDRAQEAWTKIQEIIEEGATERARALVSQEFAQRDAQAQAAQAQASLDDTVAKVIAAFPFLDSTKPTANAEAISDVVTWRDALVSKGVPMHVALAQAAQKFAPLYAQQDQPAVPAADSSKAAAAAIANAKAKPPASMSSIPASATPPADELQAMAGLSVQSIQERMMSMSPEKIMSLINKTVVV